MHGGRGTGGQAPVPVEDGDSAGDGGAGLGKGQSEGRLGCRRRRLRHISVLPRETGGLGDDLRPGRAGGFHGLAGGARVDYPGLPGAGRPPKPRLVGGQRRTMVERSNELSDDAWRDTTMAEGSQDPRTYSFSAQRVRPTSRRKPGEIHWAVYCRNLVLQRRFARKGP